VRPKPLAIERSRPLVTAAVDERRLLPLIAAADAVRCPCRWPRYCPWLLCPPG